MSTVKCAACGSSQPAGASTCAVCGTSMGSANAWGSGSAARSDAPNPVARTLDDVEPIADKGGTVPEAPVSAAVRPEHLAPPVRPAQSAQSRAAAAHLAAGTVIDGKYSIVRLLGQGGMGVVYLARDIHTGIDVVLKSVRSELAHRADVRARTLAEGRVLGQIDHPNVVHLKAVVVDDKSLWLVMQYIEGESLERTIERYAEQKQHMPLAEALRLFRQIVSGIAAAHAEGVIHRDLKPANVLLRRKDQVAKVTDFGIAKAEHEGEGRVQTKGVIGSIWYMSPEQVTGRRDLDKRVDIYALGVLLFQMLTGHVPFDADSDYEVMRAQAEKPMPLAGATRGDLPASVDVMLQKMCAKKREDRYPTCEDVLRAVDAIEAEIAGTGLSPPAVQAPSVARSAPDADTSPERRPQRPSKDQTAPPVASTRDVPHDAARPPAGDRTVSEPPPPEKTGRPGVWIGLGLVLAAVGSVATLAFTGVIPLPAGFPGAPGTARPAASEPANPTEAPSATASAGATGAPSATATAAPAPPAFDRIPGTWMGDSERALEAVRVADTIEFRVKDPARFAPADYEVGEARFVLRRIPGEENVFAVEDRLRPNPPRDFPFDRARARATCQEVRSEAGGTPLRATFDGSRLSVELMKIEPGKNNFLFEKNRTISCLGLGKLRAAKIVSVLTKG